MNREVAESKLINAGLNVKDGRISKRQILTAYRILAEIDTKVTAENPEVKKLIDQVIKIKNELNDKYDVTLEFQIR